MQDRLRFSARGMVVLCVDTVGPTGIVASWRARLGMGLRIKRRLSRISLHDVCYFLLDIGRKRVHTS